MISQAESLRSDFRIQDTRDQLHPTIAATYIFVPFKTTRIDGHKQDVKEIQSS